MLLCQRVFPEVLKSLVPVPKTVTFTYDVPLSETLNIAVPVLALFPEKMQLTTVSFEMPLFIPPPLNLALFPEKMLLLTTGLELPLHIPAPKSAALPEKVQRTTPGLEFSLYIPPALCLVTGLPFTMIELLPPSALPPVTVKPFSSAVPTSLAETTTW
ncbi:hypothetical protein D3C87_1440630 [compost metagenome]